MPEAKVNIVQTTLRLEEPFHTELSSFVDELGKALPRNERPSMHAVILRAIRDYMARTSTSNAKFHNSEETPPSQAHKLGVIFSQHHTATGQNAELHEKLDRILAGGVAAEAITKNLEAFARLTELSHGQGGPHTEPPGDDPEGTVAKMRAYGEKHRELAEGSRSGGKAVPKTKRKHPRAAIARS